MIRSHGFPESRQECSNDSERIVKIQPQSTFFKTCRQDVQIKKNAIPAVWITYNSDQVFVVAGESTTGLWGSRWAEPIGLIQAIGFSNGIAANLDLVLFCGSIKQKRMPQIAPFDAAT